VSDQTGSAMMWRRDGSELRRRGSEQCRGGGAVCRKRRIRVAVGVEWLSVSLADRSDVDAEARWIGVGAIWRPGGLEQRQRGGTTGRSGDGNAEAWWVRVTVMTRRCDWS
jgi:hypothetical protein